MKRCLHFSFALSVSFVILSFCSAANAADKLENIPLEFTPTSPMSERDPLDLKGVGNVKLQVDPFTDAREDPVLIGRNVNRVPVRKVTTRDDVPRFVTYEVKSLLSGLGFDVVESGGALILKGAVKQFFAEDGNRYKATVQLQISLADPEGKVLWAVETTGMSSRFGISYKAANYYEVLSDALIGAVHELAGNPNFKKILTGK